MPSKEISPVVEFVKMSAEATMPTKGSKHAAGYDLFSSENTSIPPMSRALVSTALQIALPDGCYGRIAPRSGLAVKNFIDVGAGVIDQDYRGEVKVLLFNFNDISFNVKKGDRIAQLVCEKIFLPEFVEVSSLKDTERGVGGFGSTGVGGIEKGEVVRT